MPLVDYSSDTSPPPSPPPPKRQKKDPTPPAPPPTRPTPPPPPDEFFDLYASTVRRSVVDDPSLHQGRRRKTPHAVGNWPSHVYITWRPSAAQQALLERLVAAAAATIPFSPDEASPDARAPLRRGAGGRKQLHSFLTDELGVSQPLHISLSRPITLTTATKDAFLEQAARAVRLRERFSVAPRRLAWFHSPDSNRTFLVLQVETVASKQAEWERTGNNEQLTRLLRQCNAVVRKFGQPELYAIPDTLGDPQVSRASSRTPNNETTDRGDRVDSCAFHISIAWILGNPTTSESGLDDAGVGGLLGESGEYGEVLQYEVPVDTVKIKIGNVVTSVPAEQ